MKTIPADHPDIRYSGRYDHRDPLAVRFSWSGSMIQFRFTGSHCAVYLESPPHPQGNRNFFAVIVDDRDPVALAIEAAQTVYTLATDLAPGEHTITLYKRTEIINFSIVTFRGIELPLTAQLRPLPPPLDRTIEIIGDSITCGFGNESNDPEMFFQDATENAYLAYGAIAARSLNANLITLCRSGLGLWRNVDGTTTPTMTDYYEFTVPPDPERWDFQSQIPDCVLINLGTNDRLARRRDRDLFVAKGVALSNRIQARYPQAKIVFLFGPMVNGNPLNTSAPIPLRDSLLGQALLLIQSTIAAQGGQPIAIFELTGQREAWGYGARWHPNLAQHQRNGAELAAYLRIFMNWN